MKKKSKFLNSKENKYTDIQSEDIRKRVKECQNHYQEGITVKELAVKIKAFVENRCLMFFISNN